MVCKSQQPEFKSTTFGFVTDTRSRRSFNLYNINLPYQVPCLPDVDDDMEAESMSESEEEGPEGYEEMDLAQEESLTTTTASLPKTRSRARSITSLDQSTEKKGKVRYKYNV